MSILRRIDGWTRGLENRSVGRIPADVWLLAARILLGFPLVMNGIGQILTPAPMEAQMSLVGVSLAWKWPAILASLLGGLAVLVGWRIRLAAALLVIYVVAATLLFHNTQNLVIGNDPMAVPELALRMCRWFIHDFKGVTTPVSNDFLRGCGVYRLWFDGAKTMDHFTMLVPLLLVLAGTGGGRYGLEHWLAKKMKV